MDSNSDFTRMSSSKQSGFVPSRASARLAACRGFTLIEVLVVISIIALLAAILFPVFNQVREKAKQTSCMSNMRQIGVALTMYINDKGEGFPPFVVGQNVALAPGGSYDRDLVAYPDDPPYPPTAPAHKFTVSLYGCKPQHFYTWMDCLFPYVKDLAIFTCPSHPNKMIHYTEDDDPNLNVDYWSLLKGGRFQLPSLGYVSGFSNIYTSVDDGYPTGVPVKQSMVVDPAQKLFLIHEYYLYSHTTATNYAQRSPNSYATKDKSSYNVQKRMWPHNDGAPQIFADGHVKWLSRKTAPKWGCSNLGNAALRECPYFEPHLPAPAA